MRRTGALFVVGLLALAGSPALAQDEGSKSPESGRDLRFDPATGRSLANWPRHPLFDHLHMKLEVSIPDPGTPRLTGRQTLRLSAIGAKREQVILDARRNMKINAVSIEGKPARFTHADEKLTIDLPEPAEPGRAFEVVTDYTATNTEREGSGLLWMPGRAGEQPLDPLVYSQGQAEWNSCWFPCHDFPNLRTTTELIVSVPEGYQVVSNGRQVGEPGGVASGKGLRVWHWLQDKPHPYYLVTLAVGKFDVVELGGPGSARPGLAMPVYGPPGSAERLRANFAKTPEMVALLEKLFDEPYPWDKYAQVIVRNFRWGGMENTSATTLTEKAAGGEPGEHDDLIVHELAHQWMGDLITCRSWAHLWLNEGWASYAEALWAEHEGGRDGYYKAILNYANEQRLKNRGSFPTAPAMVSNLYVSPDDPGTKADDVYSKGVLVLHMLRRRVGDEAFWKATRLYVDRFRFKQVETDDLRRVFEEVSGQSLERFFDQWCKRPGLPRLAVELEWLDDTRTLEVRIEQTQKIDADNPAYALSVPIRLEQADGSTEWVTVNFDEQKHQIRFPGLKGRPRQVTVDPMMNNLAAIEVRRPLAMHWRQLWLGPELPARGQALAGLLRQTLGAWHAAAADTLKGTALSEAGR
jgi:aminopeptidase N